MMCQSAALLSELNHIIDRGRYPLLPRTFACSKGMRSARPAATLGSAAKAHLALIVWSKGCRRSGRIQPGRNAHAVRRRYDGTGLEQAAGMLEMQRPQRRLPRGAGPSVIFHPSINC
jgi:hypothetical protein